MSNANSLLNEKIIELKEEAQLKDSEIDSVSIKLTEAEALLTAKDSQLEELEAQLKDLADTETEINYFAELIDWRVLWCAFKTKIKNYETKLKHENQTIIELEIEIDRLRATNKKLESDKAINQSDYEMLALEVEDFTKDIEKLQNANRGLENFLKQKELKWEELEFKLSNFAQFDTNKLDSTVFTSNEMKTKDDIEYKTNATSPILTAINKLTFSVWEILNDKQKPESDSNSTKFTQSYSFAYDILKGS